MYVVAALAAGAGCSGAGCDGHGDEVELARLDEIQCGADQATIELTTADGVVLRADLIPGPAGGRGAVVLFHMRPPAHDRHEYPLRVREAIASTGVAVLNVDRRGAGDSEGNPDEASRGPGALLDMEAAVSALLDPSFACPVDRSRLVLVAASNGTTAVMDYVVARDDALPEPAGIVWLSPGEYTEYQHTISNNRALLEVLPMLWLFPSTEPWARDFIEGAPPSWTFVERGEEHGTDMFDGGDLEAATLADLTAFIAAHGR
jgi:hypothetical protein